MLDTPQAPTSRLPPWETPHPTHPAPQALILALRRLRQKRTLGAWVKDPAPLCRVMAIGLSQAEQQLLFREKPPETGSNGFPRQILGTSQLRGDTTVPRSNGSGCCHLGPRQTSDWTPSLGSSPDVAALLLHPPGRAVPGRREHAHFTSPVSWGGPTEHARARAGSARLGLVFAG